MDNVSVVIFVVSLSGYDEIIFEVDVNAMVEALALFNEQVNNESFNKDIPFMLFLNKIDIFNEKIKSIPITVCPVFENYDGNPNDSNEVKELIENEFKDKNKVC